MGDPGEMPGFPILPTIIFDVATWSFSTSGCDRRSFTTPSVCAMGIAIVAIDPSVAWPPSRFRYLGHTSNRRALVTLRSRAMLLAIFASK